MAVGSPWHAELAATMLAAACGEDPQRWAVRGDTHTHGVTFAGCLTQIREYVRPAPAPAWPATGSATPAS